MASAVDVSALGAAVDGLVWHAPLAAPLVRHGDRPDGDGVDGSEGRPAPTRPAGLVWREIDPGAAYEPGWAFGGVLLFRVSYGSKRSASDRRWSFSTLRSSNVRSVLP